MTRSCKNRAINGLCQLGCRDGEEVCRTFPALPIAPPPIWSGVVITSADCCMNGVLIKAGTVLQVGPWLGTSDGSAAKE